MNCEYCKSEFKTNSALNNHKNKAKYCLILQGKIEPKNDIFKCNLCEKILSTKQYLELHKEKCEGKKEKIEEFKCEFCNKILSSKQYLENHIKQISEIMQKNDNQIMISNFIKKIENTNPKNENEKVLQRVCGSRNFNKIKI